MARAKAKNVGAVLSGDDDFPEAPVAKKAKAAKAVPSASDPGSDRVWIQLEENENIPPTGQFFGINGRSYMLRPGKPANVPRELINVLNDAVQSVPEVDPYTQQVIGYREKLRFPYRVTTPPRDAA